MRMTASTRGVPGLQNHYFLPEDHRLFDYDQIFSVSSMWVELGMENVIATYDLFVRDAPKNRNFLLFGGLEEIIENIKAWRFTKDEVDFLLNNNIIKPKMAKLMRTFKFSGDIWAMKEGTVFFPGEVVMRLTGPIWEVNLLTFFLINSLTSNTIFFSKIIRSILAGQGKLDILICSVTRAHSNESSLKFGRAAYLLGMPASLVPSFARKYNLPVVKANTKAYHAFIKSFPTEIDAFRAAASQFDHIGLMVDTYDYKQGIQNVIQVARELKPKGKSISFIVLDSGKDVADYARQIRYARKELDKAGFKNIKISVFGNFNEEKIAALIKTKAPADSIGPCTDLVTSIDDPKLEAVLKLAEFIRDGQTFYSAKLTPGKLSYPGRKQVFRIYKKGIMVNDVVGLATEKLGTPLLIPMVKAGKFVYQLPTLDQIKVYTASQIKTLPEKLKRVEHVAPYRVSFSKKLNELLAQAKRQHLAHLKQ